MTPEEISAAVVRHTPYMRILAGKRARLRQEDPDDALQEVWLAFVRACHSFNPEAGANLLTWATRLVNQSAIRDWRKGTREKHKHSSVSLDAPLRLEEGVVEETSLHDLLGVPAKQSDTLQGKELHQAIERLPHRERSIIRRRFFEDETLEQVGVEWGLCRERVRQIERVALERLRESLRDSEAA